MHKVSSTFVNTLHFQICCIGIYICWHFLHLQPFQVSYLSSQASFIWDNQPWLQYGGMEWDTLKLQSTDDPNGQTFVTFSIMDHLPTCKDKLQIHTQLLMGRKEWSYSWSLQSLKLIWDKMYWYVHFCRTQLKWFSSLDNNNVRYLMFSAAGHQLLTSSRLQSSSSRGATFDCAPM